MWLDHLQQDSDIQNVCCWICWTVFACRTSGKHRKATFWFPDNYQPLTPKSGISLIWTFFLIFSFCLLHSWIFAVRCATRYILLVATGMARAILVDGVKADLPQKLGAIFSTRLKVNAGWKSADQMCFFALVLENSQISKYLLKVQHSHSQRYCERYCEQTTYLPRIFFQSSWLFLHKRTPEFSSYWSTSATLKHENPCFFSPEMWWWYNVPDRWMVRFACRIPDVLWIYAPKWSATCSFPFFLKSALFLFAYSFLTQLLLEIVFLGCDLVLVFESYLIFHFC